MSLYYQDDQVTLYHGDALEVLRTLDGGSVDCVVTSPPYFGLRDYGEPGQYGLESSPSEYVEAMRALFNEARRVLADDGTLWLNLGDSYASATKGSGGTAKVTLAGPATGAYFSPRKFAMDVPAKNLLGIPWRVAFALQDDGWILRNDIVWSKPNGMPESVTDRLSTRHEHVFMFSKSPRYWFDLDPIREASVSDRAPTRRARKPLDSWKPNSAQGEWSGEADTGRNPGDVWEIPTQPFTGAHFAVMPSRLAERCVLAGCRPGGTVLDPFSGSGTTGMVAGRLGRRYVGIDLSTKFLDLSIKTRLGQSSLLDEVTA